MILQQTFAVGLMSLALVFAISAPVLAQSKQSLGQDLGETTSTTDTGAIQVAPTNIAQPGALSQPSEAASKLSFTRQLGRVSEPGQVIAPTVRTAPKRVRRAEGPIQFQRFVSEATGRNLPLFGQSLFETTDAFPGDESLPVPSSYVLGPGDEIQLQVWGATDFSAVLVIDRNGKVLIPKVGAVSLSGTLVRDLEQQLRTHLAKVFVNINLNANLARLRSVQIYVVGQAMQPGALVVSSLSTLLNAVFISGGPNAFGSMRNIQLQREGKTIATLDLYDFVARGDKSQDRALMPGDVIVIPPAGPRVAITGALDHAAIYELKDNQTSLKDLLQLTGGMPTLVNVQKALLERVQPQRLPAREVQELVLDAQGLQQTLRDGDVLTLLPMGKAFANAVTLRGNVAQPLRHAYFPGMRVADLVPDLQALVQPDYYSRKNTMVQKESGLAVGEARVVNDIKNLLEEINWDYAAIERMDAAEVRTLLIPFNLGKALKAKDPEHNLLLQAGDVVTIFGVNDLPVPAEKRSQFVRVGGEVMVPGHYQLRPGDTLPDLIARAGGLSRQAFPYGTVFSRESTRAQQQANLSKSLRQMQADINAQASTALQNITDNTEKGNNVQAQLIGQRMMLERLQGIKASGRIALDLDPEHTVFPALILEDGDQIIIPARPSFVGVFGEVFTESAMLHRPAYTVADYIDKAGLTREADIDNITIVRADGRVENKPPAFFLLKADALGKRLYPGDSVFVPARVDRRTAYSTFIQSAKDWTAILYQFGLGAAGFKAIAQ
jgi:protein involved in polysaccharide export with SLBB domain